MPYASETKRYDPAGTSKTGDLDQLVHLFLFPTIYQLAEIIEPAVAPESNRGRKSQYSVACLLGLSVAARIFGSLAETLKTAAAPGVWQQIREAYAAMTGAEQLPMTAPTRDQVNHFVSKLTTTEGLLQQVELGFRRLAVAQARLHGNLAKGLTPDWTQPQPTHLVYGDGVIMRPYSDVEVIRHPQTGEAVILNSRAKDPARARVRGVLSDTEQDRKRVVGINFVALHTWTRVGRVVLGTEVALGAEAWAALDVIDSVAALAGDAIHTVVWDRALNGWHVDYLMGRHRIQVHGLAVGASESKTQIQQDPWGLRHKPLRELIDRMAADHGVKDPSKAVQRIHRHSVLTELFYSGKPKPVGTCLYPYRGSFQKVFSRFHPLTVSHEAKGRTCTHDLVIDDEALFTVGFDPFEGYLVKTGFIPCTSAVPLERPDGRHGRRSTYQVPCGDSTFTYTYDWHPDGTRYTPDSPESSRTPTDTIGPHQRPLPRIDPRFTKPYYAGRNDSESNNNWMQNATPHYGRVASEGMPKQRLDFLSSAIVNNSDTFARSQGF